MLSINDIRRPLTLSACVLLMACGVQGATFPKKSALATGRWVRVDYPGSGLYEISYDQLRQMGFAHPEKVGVYGHGGRLLSMQFADEKGNPLYDSQPSPVAMMHTGSKIIFYGPGPEIVKQSRDGAYMRFDRESYNVYATGGSLLLTDSRSDALTPAAGEFASSELPDYAAAWGAYYHEKDTSNPVDTGREFFGEALGAEAVEIPYELPGVEEGSDALITVRAGHCASGDAKVTAILGGVSRNKVLEWSTGYCNVAQGNFRGLKLPAASGTVSITYTGEGSQWAYLDYAIVAAKGSMRFLPGRGSLQAYTADYDPAACGCALIKDAPADMVVWDVATADDVQSLPWEACEQGARVSGLRADKEEGFLLAFSPAATHGAITGWEEVEYAGLHALGLKKMPALLIITLPGYEEAAERIAALHREKDGIETAIVLHDDIINEFAHGTPDPMAYRALAKMLYDRDDPERRTFKNILLLGPCLRDYRGIDRGGEAPVSLLCNQTFSSLSLDQSFTINDWYGMLDDHTPGTPASNPQSFSFNAMQVGVGNIPAADPSEAMNYAAKLDKFYADDSVADWLAQASFVADSGNENEHEMLTEMLHGVMREGAAGTMAGSRIYTNLYYSRGTTDKFVRNMREGSMLSWYFGHSDPTTLSGEFWLKSDTQRLDNDRLGFLTSASCSVTRFDTGNRGTVEDMVMLPEHGLIGAVASVRAGYSHLSYMLAEQLLGHMLLEDPEKGDLRSTRRTIGEIYALSKTAYLGNGNENVYMLLCDPALELPLPTAGIEATVNGATGDGIEVAPGGQVRLTGEVRTREGKRINGFNGRVVAKVYAPTRPMTTTPSRGGDVAATFDIDEDAFYSVPIDVKGGRFDETFTIPRTLLERGEEGIATLRMAAFDPTTRMAAAGALAMTLTDAEEGDDLPPAIDEMYVCTTWGERCDEGEAVPSDFVLCASLSDDKGLGACSTGGFPSMSLHVDKRVARTGLTHRLAMESGGRSATLAYPLEEMSEGLHTITLEVSDGAGQKTHRTINVRVGARALCGTLSVENQPARKEALLHFESEEAPGEIASRTIVILDAAGREIYTSPMGGDQYRWTLTDGEGKRVAPGLYRALCRLEGNKAGRHGATPACDIIVY